jgi:hypothetical protein
MIEFATQIYKFYVLVKLNAQENSMSICSVHKVDNKIMHICWSLGNIKYYVSALVKSLKKLFTVCLIKEIGTLSVLHQIREN